MSFDGFEQPPWISSPIDLTLEDLSIPDNLTPLQRVERYVYSPIALQRLVHVKLITSTASSVGLEITRTVLLPLLGALISDDKVVVRVALAVELGKLGEVRFAALILPVGFPLRLSALPFQFFARGCEEGGYGVFLESVLPSLFRLVHDDTEEVNGVYWVVSHCSDSWPERQLIGSWLETL